MKAQKRRKAKVLAAIFSTAVLAVYGCGGGGGGGGGGAQPVTYSSPDQAASSTTATTATLELSSTMGDTLSGLTDTVPSTAPRMAKRMGTRDIAKLDPRLKVVVNKMASQLQAPSVKNAVKKASALRASLAPSGSVTCDNPNGSITWTGTDTSTTTYSEHDLTFTFNSCRDNTTFVEQNGTLRVYEKSFYDGSSSNVSITATAFTEKLYSANFTSLIETTVFNATFSNNAIYNANTLTQSGTFSANGSFTLTDNSGIVMSFSFNNLSDARSETFSDSTKATTTEEKDTLNGGISFNVTSSGTPTFGLSISFTNLEDKWHYVYDAYGYETEKHEWINGRITIDWNPDVSGCTEGIFDFTTADATPLTYTSTDYWSCPVSGTLQINNATIVYGRPIYVTVGSTTTPFTDCAAMGGSLCSGS